MSDMDPLGVNGRWRGCPGRCGGDYIAALGRTFERLGKKRPFFTICYPVRYPLASPRGVIASESTDMEPRGFEPLTSSMPLRRSTN
jgi:hypothetical protein